MAAWWWLAYPVGERPAPRQLPGPALPSPMQAGAGPVATGCVGLAVQAATHSLCRPWEQVTAIIKSPGLGCDAIDEGCSGPGLAFRRAAGAAGGVTHCSLSRGPFTLISRLHTRSYACHTHQTCPRLCSAPSSTSSEQGGTVPSTDLVRTARAPFPPGDQASAHPYFSASCGSHDQPARAAGEHCRRPLARRRRAAIGGQLQARALHAGGGGAAQPARRRLDCLLRQGQSLGFIGTGHAAGAGTAPTGAPLPPRGEGGLVWSALATCASPNLASLNG